MKKTTILHIIMCLVFPAIFNVCFFLISKAENRTATVWISYGFIHFAYLMFVCSPFFTRKGKSSSIFGRSVYAISTVYFIVVLTAGIIMMSIPAKNDVVTWVSQLVALGIYLVVLILHLIANEHTADAEEARQPQIDFIKSASSKVKLMVDSASDKQTNRKIGQVYDLISTSPIKTDSSAAQIESSVLSEIDLMRGHLDASENAAVVSCAQRIISQLNERNQLLKSSH
ncbi:MAG: hypothetical protein FWD58_04890 [Firmicutes bacterium]|nr:hypothetical protein [Bacillota bacterium]